MIRSTGSVAPAPDSILGCNGRMLGFKGLLILLNTRSQQFGYDALAIPAAGTLLLLLPCPVLLQAPDPLDHLHNKVGLYIVADAVRFEITESR